MYLKTLNKHYYKLYGQLRSKVSLKRFLLWYGSKNNYNLKSKLNRKRMRLLDWQNQNNVLLRSRSSLYSRKFLLVIPTAWNLLLLTSKTNLRLQTIVYLNSSTYFFKFTLPVTREKLTFNKQLHLLELNFLHFYHSLNFYLNFIQSLFLTFSLPLFLKLKFKGKGYYIFKNSRNTITPQFGFSHRIYIYSFSVLVKFLSKTTIFLFGLSKKDLIRNGLLIKNIRPINIFTGRGIRFAKQIVYRKVGKVSSYR